MLVAKLQMVRKAHLQQMQQQQAAAFAYPAMTWSPHCCLCLQRCSSSIISTFNQVADDMMSEMGRGADRSSRMRPPSFARAQEVLRRYSELLRVLHSLDPSAFTKVQMSFASSMSTVIRWGWQGCCEHCKHQGSSMLACECSISKDSSLAHYGAKRASCLLVLTHSPAWCHALQEGHACQRVRAAPLSGRCREQHQWHQRPAGGPQRQRQQQLQQQPGQGRRQRGRR
jgi:hypothetical protein